MSSPNKTPDHSCQHQAVIRTTEQVKPGEPIVRIVWRCAKCDKEFFEMSRLERTKLEFEMARQSFESRSWNDAIDMCMRMINPGYWLIYTGPGGFDPEPIQFKAMKRLKSIKQQDISLFPLHMQGDVHRRNTNIMAGHKLCKKCDGTGNEIYSMYKKCSECGGSGSIPRSEEERQAWDKTQEDIEMSDEESPDICPDEPANAEEKVTEAPEPETSDKEPDDVRNMFGVFAYHLGTVAKEGVVVGRWPGNFVLREEALNLAAWLAAFADPTQKDFPALLKKVVDLGNE